MSEETTGKYAFWGYDRYPYVLGGEALKLESRPHPTRLVAMPAGYGNGWFRVRHVTSVKEGVAMHEKLKRLHDEYRREQDELRKKYMQKALEAAPFLKRFGPYRELSDANRKG